jgi:tetratricopeptide (TPR) repeat protein
MWSESPRNVEARRAQGALLSRQGRTREALAQLHQAMQLAPLTPRRRSCSPRLQIEGGKLQSSVYNQEMTFSFLRTHPRRVLLALIVLAAVAVGAWQFGVRWRARSEYQAALRALDAYDLDGARGHLNCCLRLQPGDTDALLLAARCARRSGDLNEASRYLADLRSRHALPQEIALERALAEAQQGELAGVERDLRSMVEHDHPRTLLILEALARGYQATYQMPSMIDCLDKLLENWPDDVAGRLLRGRGLEALRRDEEAVVEYERAVALAPRLTEARLALAETLRRLCRTRDAVAQYECLRRLHPGHARVLLGLAVCRFDLGEVAEARHLLDSLLEQYPDHVVGLVERGRLAYRAGRAADGEKDLRRAFALAPSHPDVLRVLVLCLEGQGKEAEARPVRGRLSQIEADLMRLTTLKAKLAQEGPRDATAYCGIGTVLLRLGREEEAVPWFQTALQLDPHHVPTHTILADYFERTGRTERARRHRAAGGRKDNP